MSQCLIVDSHIYIALQLINYLTPSHIATIWWEIFENILVNMISKKYLQNISTNNFEKIFSKTLQTMCTS